MSENEDIIVLYDEDGNEENYEHIDTIEFNGESYVVLTPAPEEAEEESDDLEVVFMKIVPDPENAGDQMLVVIDDDDELDAVFAEFSRIMDEYEDADE
ncbi:MAG: DUF1292 domain-containing protein [Clostridia bacterium]|nr:DUF1292 domain-containing protein [Clostridia bacterium]